MLCVFISLAVEWHPLTRSMRLISDWLGRLQKSSLDDLEKVLFKKKNNHKKDHKGEGKDNVNPPTQPLPPRLPVHRFFLFATYLKSPSIPPSLSH